jgi:PGF-CTERM protein
VEVPVTEIGRVTFVVEGADGRVAGAEIAIRQPGTNVGTLTTNGSGVVRSGPLELGDYTARVTAPGHLQTQASFEVTRVEKTETVSVQRADVDVRVTVVDDRLDPPEPVGNARVRFTDLGTTLTTNSNGRVTASVPVNDDHRIRVSKDGYDATRRTVSVAEQQTSIDVAIQREPSLSLESVNRRVVVGESTVVTVADEYGERVEGATVSVDGERVGQTDAQGEIRVPVEERGEVTIEAASGDTTATITVEGVDPDATETPTTTPTPAGTPTATPAPTSSPTPGGSGPGFGVVAALLAVLAVGLLARRR